MMIVVFDTHITVTAVIGFTIDFNLTLFAPVKVWKVIIWALIASIRPLCDCLRTGEVLQFDVISFALAILYFIIYNLFFFCIITFTLALLLLLLKDPVNVPLCDSWVLHDAKNEAGYVSHDADVAPEAVHRMSLVTINQQHHVEVSADDGCDKDENKGEGPGGSNRD